MIGRALERGFDCHLCNMHAFPMPGATVEETVARFRWACAWRAVRVVSRLGPVRERLEDGRVVEPPLVERVRRYLGHYHGDVERFDPEGAVAVLEARELQRHPTGAPLCCSDPGCPGNDRDASPPPGPRGMLP